MSALGGIRSLGSINISFGGTTAKSSSDSLVVGGIPRVHLLPPEIEIQKKGRAQRRRVLVALFVVIVLVVVGFGASTFSLVSANAALATQQARASAFSMASAKYSKVVQIEGQMSEVKLAEKLASVGEIDWQPYIAELTKTLPAGMTITTLAGSLDSTDAQAATTTTPLAATHVATVKITAKASSMTISDWLENLRTVKGVVDVNPGAVTLDPAGTTYNVDVTVLVNSKALSNRFQKVN
jgi:Tfp pilus assembly protein PilN